MSLGKNVLKLVSSRVAVQVITFSTAPIIVRLFSPDQFGVRQVFMSIFYIITVISCLRYELSIPLGRNKREAAASFTLSMLFTLIFTFVLLVLVPFLKGSIARWYKMPELEIFLGLLPVFILLMGLRVSIRYWAARERKFGAIAWSDFGSALGHNPVTLAWGLIIGSSLTGLFVGSFGGIAVGLTLLLVFCGRKLISDIKNAHLDFKVLLKVAKLHKKFPIFSTWSGLLNAFSNQLPVIILGLYFPKAVVGYYFLARSMANLPMRFVGESVGQVFFPTAAKEYNKTGNLSKIVRNIFKRLVQIGIFPMVTLSFLGAPLFGFVFGERWIEAGVYAQILAPWLLIMFISSPLSTVFSILNRQGTNLILNMISIVGRAGSLLAGCVFFSPRVALGMFTAFSVFIYIVRIIFELKLSNVSILWAAKKISKYVAFSCILILPVKFISWFAADLIVVLATVFVIMVYAAVLLKVEPSLGKFVLTILRKLEIGKSSIQRES